MIELRKWFFIYNDMKEGIKEEERKLRGSYETNFQKEKDKYWMIYVQNKKKRLMEKINIRIPWLENITQKIEVNGLYARGPV